MLYAPSYECSSKNLIASECELGLLAMEAVNLNGAVSFIKAFSGKLLDDHVVGSYDP